MKYTKDQRLDIWKRIYEGAISRFKAVESTPAAEQSSSTRKVAIISESGEVNIRIRKAAGFSLISKAVAETTLDYIAKAENGRNAVLAINRAGRGPGNIHISFDID